jgi:hypothetical protein
MQLQYDAALIEGIVFLEVRRLEQNGESLLVARYERQRTALYDIADPDERNTAFFELHLKWFRDLGLEDPIRTLLKQFPIITGNTATLLVRRTVTKKDEGAELFVRPDANNVAIAIRCERIFEPGFEPFLRHELCHISDMLDPAFAYEPEIRLPDAPPAELDLLRERYRVLWDITIDGRLNQNKLARLAEFQKALPNVSEKKFEELWAARPSHPELVTLAKSVLARSARTPGAPCPLCKFPTFVWADAPPVEAVRRDFPRWLTEHGCCARCAELYSMQPQAQPATLFV